MLNLLGMYRLRYRKHKDRQSLYLKFGHSLLQTPLVMEKMIVSYLRSCHKLIRIDPRCHNIDRRQS